MNSLTKIIVIVFVSAALLALVIYWFTKDYMPKYRWNENYSYQSDQPYGLKLFYDLLSDSHRGSFEIIETAPRDLEQSEDSTSLYLIIGNNCFIDSATSEILMDFVSKGNTMLISSVYASHEIYSSLTYKKFPFLYEETFDSSKVNVAFKDAGAFLFDYRISGKIFNRQWLGMDSAIFRDSLYTYGFREVSKINKGLIDCYQVKYGKGKFIFQSNPVLFTNYYLSKEKGLDYINTLLGTEGRHKIYWDEYSKIYRRNSGGTPPIKSPLHFILSERSLKWSWYLLCSLIVLFVLVNSKRKQAIIPLLPENKNTTVDYIQAVATLHYQYNSLELLAEERMKQFLSYVKRRYGISSNLERKEYIKVVAKASGLSEKDIADIYKYYLDIKYLPETKDMLELYNLTEYFYQNCK